MIHQVLIQNLSGTGALLSEQKGLTEQIPQCTSLIPVGKDLIRRHNIFFIAVYKNKLIILKKS